MTDRTEHTVTIGGVDHTMLLSAEEAKRRYGDLAKRAGGGDSSSSPASAHTKKATPPNKAATPKDK